MSLYEEKAKLLKVLADPSRLAIVDMLSCGEMCACNILKQFDFTQPALSHHMKVLCDSGLVIGRRDGAWMHYTLVVEKFAEIAQFIIHVSNEKEDCICKDAHRICNE